VDVVAVDEFVNAHALLANAVEKGSSVSGENFTDGCVAEHGVKAADYGGQLVWWAAAAGALDGLDSVADAVDAVADGVRKIAVEEQEFEDTVGGKSAV